MNDRNPNDAAETPMFTPSGARWVVGVVIAVWLIVGAADWVMRFRWFQWHQLLVYRPAAAAQTQEAGLARYEAPASRGGDLSHLIGIPSAARPFEQERPAMEVVTDEHGYRNTPPTDNRTYPVVVAGASFMVSGYPQTNSFSEQLATVSGLPVYNHAVAGRGPFYGLVRFMHSPHFREHPPRILVWGIVEREVGGGVFGGLTHQLQFEEHATPTSRPPSLVIAWHELTPQVLKSSLPNTSLLAQLSARAWNRVRYDLFGRLNPEVAASTGPVEGAGLLFYTPAVRALKWGEARKLPEVVYPIQDLDRRCRTRGIQLLVLLIPDKEQVYRELLPAYLNNPADPIPPSCLVELEARLRREGIPVVNCLPAFRARAQAGELLYWRDDTHWNARGIRLAAELVNSEMQRVLTPGTPRVD